MTSFLPLLLGHGGPRMNPRNNAQTKLSEQKMSKKLSRKNNVRRFTTGKEVWVKQVIKRSLKSWLFRLGVVQKWCHGHRTQTLQSISESNAKLIEKKVYMFERATKCHSIEHFERYFVEVISSQIPRKLFVRARKRPLEKNIGRKEGNKPMNRRI